MTKRILALATMALFPHFAQAAPTWAYTDDGKQVILHENGTWEAAPEQEVEHHRTFRSRRGAYAIRYDTRKWTQVQDHRASSSDAEFVYVSGEGYALAIYEPQAMTPDQLRQAVLINMRSVDPNASVVNQKTVTIGGEEVLALEIEASAGQLPFTYLGYYYTGERGSLQFITYTTTNLAADLMKDFQELLDGLVFLESP